MNALDERAQPEALSAREHDRPEPAGGNAREHRIQRRHPKDMRDPTRKDSFKRIRRARSKCAAGSLGPGARPSSTGQLMHPN